MKSRRVREQFPRTAQLPKQSSKYWAKEKDRYIRQTLIADIEEQTERELIVYFARVDQNIVPTDCDDLSEMFEGVESRNIDLFLHTPGGQVDAVEKIITVLKQRTDSYRVIVPSWAKSGGTIIAIASNEIVLGVNSELGPIDPQLTINGISAPAEFIAKDPTQQVIVQKIAERAVDRSIVMAKKILSEGMLKGKTEEEIEETVRKISSATAYGSHGAVIDYNEAVDLGLSVQWLSPDNELWRRIWLLYCLYEYDTNSKNLGKIFEGAVYSIARPPLGR